MYNRSIGSTLFRLFACLLLLKDFLIYLLNRELLLGSQGIMPYGIYRHGLHAQGIGFLQYSFNNALLLALFCLAGIALTILYALGTRRLLTGGLLWIMVILVRERNIFIMDGADNVMWVLLPFSFLSYSHPFLNVPEKPNAPARLRWLAALKRVVRLWAPKAFMVQVCLIYLFAALSKLGGPLWVNGVANYYILRVNDFKASNLNVYLTENYFFVKITTYLTIAWELLFPFLAWVRKARPYLIAVSVAMHAGILVMMRIDNYSFLMLSTYCVFFTDSDYRKAAGRLKSLRLRYRPLMPKKNFITPNPKNDEQSA